MVYISFSLKTVICSFFFVMYMWVFLTSLFFFLRISFFACPTPPAFLLSGWGRKEKNGMKVPWGAGLGARKPGPFPFALFSARALDQKLYLKQELHFPQQKQKAISPLQRCFALSVIFSGSTWLARSVPRKPHSLSSPQMNRKILWSDRTQQTEAWLLLCAHVCRA